MRMREITNVFVMLAGIALLGGCATSGVQTKTLSKEEEAQYHVNIGNGALTEGDATGALIEYDRAEKLGLHTPELLHSKALAYYKKGNLAEAIRFGRQAVSEKPNYTDALNTLGKLLVDANKPAEAEKVLKRAAADPLYRDGFKPLTTLGIMYYRQGEMDKAERQLSDAIRANGIMSCVARYYRGNVRLKQGNVNGALEDYDRAVMNSCGKFSEAHYAKAVALRSDQRFDEARKKFLEVTKLFPGTEIANQAMTQLRTLP